MGEPIDLLLVEDSEADRLLICTLLGAFEDAPRVSCARTAAEGLAAVRSKRFDCVLVDYVLPDGTASGVLEALGREPWPPPPALVVTGMGSEQIATDVFKSGASDYLPKADLTTDLLRRRIDEALGSERPSLQGSSRKRSDADAEERLHETVWALRGRLEPPMRSLNQDMREIHLRLENVNPELSDRIERIREHAQRSGRVLRDLLRYLRLHLRQSDVCEVDPADAVHVATLSVQSALRADDRIEIAKLPTVVATPQHLVDLFRILLDNCVVHRSDAPLEVRIRGRRMDDRVEITIDDNGPGIPDEACERVFGLFERVAPATPYSGTGAGLAMARRILQLHGGSIEAVPVPNGARIRFALPAARRMQ